MEENYISKYEDTHWYTNFIKKTYGVCINIKDVHKTEKILKKFRKDHKIQIDSLKKEWKESVK